MEGKTAILRGLVKDVSEIKKQFDDIGQIKNEISDLVNNLKETDLYAHGVTSWIKNNLGTSLEILDKKIELAVESRQKQIEANVWAVFSVKFEDSKMQFELNTIKMKEKQDELETSLIKMKEELEKSNELRIKNEKSIKQLEETFEKLKKQRIDEEAQLFRKLTLKLEDERRSIEDERRKMSEERKKYKYMIEKQKFEAEKTQSSNVLNKSNNSISPTLIQPSYQNVFQWLQAINLEQYSSNFESNGYDSIYLCSLLDKSDLDILGIKKYAHRKAFLVESSSLQNSKSINSNNKFSLQLTKNESLKRPLPKP